MGRRQRGTRRAAEQLSWQERHTLSIESMERERLLTQHHDLAVDVASTTWII